MREIEMREWNNMINKEIDEKTEEIKNKDEQINIMENDK